MDRLYVHLPLALTLICACGDASEEMTTALASSTQGVTTAPAPSTSTASSSSSSSASASSSASSTSSPSSSTSPATASSATSSPTSGGETTADAMTTEDDASSSGAATTGAVEPEYELLLDLPGAFFTASEEEPFRIYKPLGEPGAALRRIEIEYDVELGPFRVDIPPNNEERWDHILHGLSRANQPNSYLRYLIGASARIETNAADRAFNYGRVAIEMGAASYKSWKKNYPWQEYSEIHVVQWIDADAHEQTLELYKDGALDFTVTGPVEYFTPELTTDQLELELGTEDADWGLHVSPHGWTFKNLQLRGWLAE